MLDAKDIELLKAAVGEVVEEKLEDKLEEKLEEKLEKKLDEKLEEKLEKKLDEKLEEKLNPLREELQHTNNKIDVVLDEVVRVHENLQAQIDALEKNVAELRQYYRVDKLENDNMTLMLRLVNDLVKRVEELERRIA